MKTSEISSVLSAKKQMLVRSLYVAERIETKTFEKTQLVAYSPLTIRVGEKGFAVIFRYGATVLFDVAPMEELAFLNNLHTLLVHPLEKPETEEVPIRIDKEQRGRFEGEILIHEITLEHMQVIADILAKTVVLNYYETSVSKNFESIEPLAITLKEQGHRGSSSKELLNHIGEVLINQHNMVGRVEVTEKPEILWNNPGLEGLYRHLETEFEIRDRHRALERKLELITRTAETVLDLLDTKRSLRVEWYIVILIIFEIFLTLYDMFLK
ncbi:MAG: RMD1 family protein [Ignavibacteriales bacterium]|nr:RMD1 family protein [Ignavibacteriales bacterium]MCF8305839.1 RMD1 family protein [Ignavibacteriales bacterium]MCF8315561.1 RMD1 family protein [Ignavibacteriales bacterium]MCF8436909.1 RMD1 family protein [Ignavibacteriales bacterium]